jgi:hypothetical protein
MLPTVVEIDGERQFYRHGDVIRQLPEATAGLLLSAGRVVAGVRERLQTRPSRNVVPVRLTSLQRKPAQRNESSRVSRIA